MQASRTNLTGRDIRSLREQAGLSAAKLAAELGLGKHGWRTVYRWETGEKITPRTAAQITAWAKVRGIELREETHD